MRGVKFMRTALLLPFLALASGAGANWAILGAEVPVPRLIKNVSAYIQAHPNEAQGYYVLGRVHSLAFAQADAKMIVYYKKDLDWIHSKERKNEVPSSTKELPQFPSPDSILEGKYGPTQREWRAEAFAHLIESVRNYQRATQLAPTKGLYWLGLGWMLEQAQEAQAHGGPQPSVIAPHTPAWYVQAIAAYQHAYDISYPHDSKQQELEFGADSISLESGEGMLRMMQGHALNPLEKVRQARLQLQMAELKRLPRGVTPIIFPLRGQTALERMVDARRTTTFDLAGDGRNTRWPWVTPDTGILVWDPGHTGNITSGRQLFGSATWWMFFQNGYEALAALDDDHDGQLSGRELAGIAVWRDRNGNGVCDPGEVVNLSRLGITGIAAHSAGLQSGALWNSHGLRRADGTFLPTYDWTPTSK